MFPLQAQSDIEKEIEKIKETLEDKASQTQDTIKQMLTKVKVKLCFVP